MPAFSFKYTTNASAGGTPKAFPIESWNQGTPRYPHHFAFPKGSLQRVSLKIPLAHIPIPYQTQFPKDSCRYNALSFPTTIQSISVDSQSCTTLLELLLWIIPVLIRFLLLCCFGIFCFLYTLQTHSLPFPGVSAGWSNTCICSFFNPSRSERAAQPSQKPKGQHLAAGQTPCCTCGCSGRSVFSWGRLLPWGQWAGMDGWTVDLRGGLGNSTHPVCQCCGSSGPNVYSLAIAHSCLVICLWASPRQTHTSIDGNVFNILSNTSFMRL